MFLFQHLKNNVPLFSAFLVSDEKSVIILTVFMLVVCPFSSDCFQDFPFIFVFSLLTMMCLYLVFFVLILLGVLWHWICGLISFISLGKFLTIILSVFLSCSFLCFWDYLFMVNCLLLSYRASVLVCFFHFSLSLCFSPQVHWFFSLLFSVCW